MASSSDKNVKALGAKLLAGWTMLEETCSAGSCLVPLMENRKGDKTILCVACNSEFVRDNGQIVLKKAGEAQAPSTTKAASENANHAANTAATTPSAPSAPSPATPTASTTSAAAATNTPAAPAAAATKGGDDSDDEWTPPTAEELAAMEERRKRTDKTSALLGEKLLKGWTMLADSCLKPNCCVPLMRDPATGKHWCVSCNTAVADKDEPASNSATAAAAAAASDSKAATGGTAKGSGKPAAAPTSSTGILNLGPTVSVSHPENIKATAAPAAAAKRAGGAEGSHVSSHKTAARNQTTAKDAVPAAAASSAAAGKEPKKADKEKEPKEKDSSKHAGDKNKDKPKKRRMQTDDSDSDTPEDLPRLEVRFDQHQRQQQSNSPLAGGGGGGGGGGGEGPTRPRDEEQVLSRAVVSILSQIETATRQLAKSDAASASQAIVFLKDAFVTLGGIRPLFNSMRPSEAAVRKWINENMGAILEKAGRVLLRRLDRLSEELSDTHDWEKARLVVNSTALCTSALAVLKELMRMG